MANILIRIHFVKLLGYSHLQIFSYSRKERNFFGSFSRLTQKNLVLNITWNRFAKMFIQGRIDKFTGLKYKDISFN